MVGATAVHAVLPVPVLHSALRASKVPVEGHRGKGSSQRATLASGLVYQLLYDSEVLYFERNHSRATIQ